MKRGTRWSWFWIACLFWVHMVLPTATLDWVGPWHTNASMRRMIRYARRWERRFCGRGFARK